MQIQWVINKNHYYVKIKVTNEVKFILGNLCLEYGSNMQYFDEKIKKMKMQYNIHL